MAQNNLALEHGHLRPDRSELLSAFMRRCQIADRTALDDLPKNLSRLGERVKGVVLVDHNHLVPRWGTNTTVLSIIDHHRDRGMHLDASPRIVSMDAKSCSSLVGMEILNHEHKVRSRRR